MPLSSAVFSNMQKRPITPGRKPDDSNSLQGGPGSPGYRGNPGLNISWSARVKTARPPLFRSRHAAVKPATRVPSFRSPEPDLQPPTSTFRRDCLNPPGWRAIPGEDSKPPAKASIRIILPYIDGPGSGSVQELRRFPRDLYESSTQALLRGRNLICRGIRVPTFVQLALTSVHGSRVGVFTGTAVAPPGNSNRYLATYLIFFYCRKTGCGGNIFRPTFLGSTALAALPPHFPRPSKEEPAEEFTRFRRQREATYFILLRFASMSSSNKTGGCRRRTWQGGRGARKPGKGGRGNSSSSKFQPHRG